MVAAQCNLEETPVCIGFKGAQVGPVLVFVVVELQGAISSIARAVEPQIENEHANQHP